MKLDRNGVLGSPVILRLLLLCLAASPAVGSQEDEDGSRVVLLRGDDRQVVSWCTQFERWDVPKPATFDCAARGTPPSTTEPVLEVEIFQLPVETPERHALDRRLHGLPAEVDGQTLRFGGSVYDDPRHVLAVRRGPGEPGTGRWTVVGRDPDQIQGVVSTLVIPALGAFPWREFEPFDYLVFESSGMMRAGRWQPGEEVEPDPNERDDLAARDRLWASRQTSGTGALLLRAPRHRTQELEPWLRTLARDLAAMERRLGSALERPIDLMVEDDFETMARHLGALGTAVVQRDRVHLVVDARNRGADEFLIRQELARLLLRRAGLALPPWIEDGAALWLSAGRLSGSWYGRDRSDWPAAVAAAGVLPTADELLAGERQRDGSGVLWPPVAAAVVDALPGDTLRAKLDPMPRPEAARRLLEDVLAEMARSASEPPPTAVPVRQSGLGHHSGRSQNGRFHNGVSLAMANGIETGYHAAAVEEQLDWLRGLGADAVSVMPFAYVPDPHAPGLRFMNHRPASETDTGLLHVARRARERGMVVLWKPHLWIGHHSWPGDVEMRSEADWRAWFRDYRRYVMHHAVLAEHAGAQWFCVGVELGRTVTRQDDWRHLIESVRRVYSGRLTYAGNWWGDYEHVEFWDALDAVGVDAYFPLAHADDADRAALAAGARDAVAKLRAVGERWNRPVLLTEAGFAARVGAWVSPHEEGGRLSVDHQRLAWEVFLEELGKPPWLLGLYAWKAYSHPRGEGRGPNFDFTDRPAEQVLEAYYRSRPTELRVDVTSQ